MDLERLTRDVEEEIISTRRWLHAHPEVGTCEVETTRYIAARLEALGIPTRTFEGITGCMGVIEGAQPGRTLLLRADIDALPIQEEPGKPYCSVNPGVMHACGHDCHTAMLLGAARILQEHRDELRGTVKLLFQMGEEIGRMSEEYVKRGALEGVDAIFGMHIWSLLDAGRANFEGGPRMACSDRFTIRVHGTAAHGSAPHLGHDALLAASAVVLALQSLASRVKDPLESLVVSVGMMNGGTKENILCSQVELVGTVRAFDRTFRDGMPARIRQVAENTAAAYGCTAECTYYFGPSPLINDDAHLNRLAAGAAEKVLGPGCLCPLDKGLGAEDFSVYLEHIPGVYGFLGFRNPEKGIVCSHHHPAFDVDESVLRSGTGIYVQFALDFLND